MIERYKPGKPTSDHENGEEYGVGYGKPPLHSRFKPGQSGNPKGRKKGVANFATDVKTTLKAPVKVTRDGRPRQISTQEAMLLRLREKALSGDARALDRLLALAQVYNSEVPAAVALASEDDLRLLAIFEDRVRRGAIDSSAGKDIADRSGAPDDAAEEKATSTDSSQRSSLKRVRRTSPKSAPGSS
jgi:hypothetical protein